MTCICSDRIGSFTIFLEKHPTGLLAGGAFAPYKRFATGKTLAQGEFTSPEHFNHRKVERPTGRNSKENATCIDKSHFLLVEVRGVEPLSESTLTGLSPGADGYCGSLSPCSPSGRQAVTPSGQVRVIMRGRGNSYPPHGRHINDAFPGLWPLRFRRPPLIRQQ